MYNRVLPCVLVLALIAACDSRQDPATAKIWFEPASMQDCNPPAGQVATIHWDASKSSAKIVDIKVVGPDEVEGTFATSGQMGSKISGAWMLPGSVVIARDHDTGMELGRAVAGSTPCKR